MQPEESSYPGDWLRLAERDLVRVERLLGAGDPALAGFCLQQAVEKALKAFLLAKGWRLRRIHDLEALLDDAVMFDLTIGRFRVACQSITTYYMVERYPFEVGEELDEAEVRGALEAVGELFGLVRDALRPPST